MRTLPKQLDATIDAAPTGPQFGTALSHTLFINTEGVTVAPGSDNAVANTTSLVNSSVALKPWLMGDSQRATKIAAVIDQVKATVAPYNITVVNARPAAGPYHMVVITASCDVVSSPDCRRARQRRSTRIPRAALRLRR